MDRSNANPTILNMGNGENVMSTQSFWSLQSRDLHTTSVFAHGDPPLLSGTGATFLSRLGQQPIMPFQGLCMNCWNMIPTVSFDIASCCTDDTSSASQAQLNTIFTDFLSEESSVGESDYSSSVDIPPSKFSDAIDNITIRPSHSLSRGIDHTDCEMDLALSSCNSPEEAHLTIDPENHKQAKGRYV